MNVQDPISIRRSRGDRACYYRSCQTHFHCSMTAQGWHIAGLVVPAGERAKSVHVTCLSWGNKKKHQVTPYRKETKERIVSASAERVNILGLFPGLKTATTLGSPQTN